MTLTDFLSRLDGRKKCGGYYIARCPAHGDKHQSLSISEKDGRILVNCHAGCSANAIVGAMGLELKDLFQDSRPQAGKQNRRDVRQDKPKRTDDKQPKPWRQRGTIVVSYEYRNDSGELLAVKDRYENKFMSWRHPDGSGGWLDGSGGREIPLYKHECIGNPVYLVEGEKDVDTLRAAGLYAVCNPNGAAENWQDRYTDQLKGFDVRVIPDNDDIGRKHADKVCNALIGAAASVKLIDLKELWPEIPNKGDVTDWFEWCRQQGREDEKITQCLTVYADGVPEFVLETAGEDPPEEEKTLDYSKVTASSVGDIDFSQTPEVEFYIDRILAQGVTFLNAFSKVGKSRMIVQMLLAVCNGTPFLQHQTKRSAVLYLALEDERIDFENRMKRFLRDAPQPDNFYYVTKEAFEYETPTLDNGLLPFLESQLAQHPEIKVIAVDVFGVIRSKRRMGEDFAVHERRDVDALIKFAAEHQTALLIAHHVSKAGLHQARSSSTGSGAGSYVISGTVHAELEIALDSSDENRAKFSVKGRRMKASHFAIRDEFPYWKLEGDWEAVTFADDPVVATVKWLVDQYGQWKGSIKQLVEANIEHLDELPQIINKPNKRTIEKFARQLQSCGIRYTQIKNGNASPLHEFVRGDDDSINSFSELTNSEEWEDLQINSL